MNNAALNALEAYVAETGAAKVKLFDQRRGEFASNINLRAMALTIIKGHAVHFIILMQRLRQTSRGVLTSTEYNNGTFHGFS